MADDGHEEELILTDSDEDVVPQVFVPVAVDLSQFTAEQIVKFREEVTLADESVKEAKEELSSVRLNIEHTDDVLSVVSLKHDNLSAEATAVFQMTGKKPNKTDREKIKQKKIKMAECETNLANLSKQKSTLRKRIQLLRGASHFARSVVNAADLAAVEVGAVPNPGVGPQIEGDEIAQIGGVQDPAIIDPVVGHNA